MARKRRELREAKYALKAAQDIKTKWDRPEKSESDRTTVAKYDGEGNLMREEK